MNIYDYVVKDASGKDVPLSTYKGKVLLIVNTASKCGFTPQYKELENLYKTYGKEGLMILGFPCNQFAHQEPASDGEIQSFCQINYGVTFPVMGKIEVNGDNADPLFKFLKSSKRGLLTSSIKWNFTKFLVDKDGNVVKRYAPTVSPSNIESTIQKLLA